MSFSEQITTAKKQIIWSRHAEVCPIHHITKPANNGDREGRRAGSPQSSSSFRATSSRSSLSLTQAHCTQLTLNWWRCMSAPVNPVRIILERSQCFYVQNIDAMQHVVWNLGEHLFIFLNHIKKKLDCIWPICIFQYCRNATPTSTFEVHLQQTSLCFVQLVVIKCNFWSVCGPARKHVNLIKLAVSVTVYSLHAFIISISCMDFFTHK